MNNFVKNYFLIGFGSLLLTFLFIKSSAINESGYRQHVRTFTGTEYVRFAPGFHFHQPFSTVTDYTDVITVQYGTEDEQGDDVTFFSGPHGVKFNGGDDARIGHTVKWDLPDDEKSMIEIHKHYRSADRLASTTLSQYQSETANYSTQMIDSESHYSGGQSTLKEFFQDQLRNGQILLDKRTVTEIDTTTGESKVVIKVNPRLDANGNKLRTLSDIQKYNITPSFVSIDHVEYDSLIEAKLAAKIESATRKSISEQLLITAQQEAITAVEEGKKRIEDVRARKEAEKLEAVIAAQQAKEVAREEALQAKFIADRIAEEGRAQAVANRALVDAGLTPEQEMQRDIKIAEVVSQNIAQLNFPKMMILGSGNNGQALNPWDAVGIESFLNIQKRFYPTKGN